MSPYFWSRGTRRLHGVAISHLLSDHVGMRSIIENFRPQELWYRLESPTPESVELAATARNFGVAFRPRVAGEAFDFGSVQASVLNPRVGESAANPAQDDESMLLRFQFRETSALLVGDAHRRTGSLLEGENPRADPLKIGHQGRATSSSPDFLQAVASQFAVVSAGYYNTFRHQQRNIMKRCADWGIRTYRTALAGEVRSYLDGEKVTAQTAPH